MCFLFQTCSAVCAVGSAANVLIAGARSCLLVSNISHSCFSGFVYLLCFLCFTVYRFTRGAGVNVDSHSDYIWLHAMEPPRAPFRGGSPPGGITSSPSQSSLSTLHVFHALEQVYRERNAAASAAALHADPDMGGGFTYPFYSHIRGPMDQLSSTMTLGSRIVAHMTPRLGKQAALALRAGRHRSSQCSSAIEERDGCWCAWCAVGHFPRQVRRKGPQGGP